MDVAYCGSCENGLLIDEESNTAYPCSCRRFAVKRARSAALTERKRAQCRRAGKASGRRRRQLARGRSVPHSRNRELGLARAYPKVRQLTRAAFETLYARTAEAEGWIFDRRGLNTAYELYRADFASYRGRGQEFETTNRQRQAALELRGRGRSRRTVQRTRKRLEAMGLVAYEHVKRGHYIPGVGWKAGQSADTLRVRLLRCSVSKNGANGTLPTGAETAPLRGAVVSALTTVIAPSARAVPPDGGDQRRAASPPGSEDGGVESLRRSADPYRSGHSSSRNSSSTSAGFR